MACYSCGTPYCSCSNRYYTSSNCQPCYQQPCYVTSGCPIQLDFSCVLYHKSNNEVTELDGLNLSNGATLELVIETIDEKIKQLAVLDFSLPFLRESYVINTMKQFTEAVDTELSTITSGVSSSGSYTPTLTQVLAASNPTANVATYTRIGNVVTVYGSFSLTTAIGTDVKIGISLPVASAFTVKTNLSGVLTSSDSTSTAFTGEVYADGTNDRAELSLTGAAAGTFTAYYTFQYIVI